MASPFTFSTTKPASGDALNAFPAFVQGQWAALLAVLGTLIPTGTPTTGMRVYQNNNEIVFTTNVATLNTSTLAITQDDATAPSWAAFYSAANNNFNWYHAAAGGGTLTSLASLTVGGNFTASGDLLSGNLQLGASGVVKNQAATATMGLTAKKGTGLGNYTTSSATFVRVDSTNLAFAVTIPTGWKLLVEAHVSVFSNASASNWNLALADGTADNTGILVQQPINESGNRTSVSIGGIVAGDGASHTINLQWHLGTAASLQMDNSSATSLPTMEFLLVPSN